MPVRFVLTRARRFFIYRVLHVDDTPHRIALGIATGIFIAWTPTVGFQMALTLLLSWLLGANKLAGLPFVWVSNPFTMFFIYYPNYLLGKSILGGKYPNADFIEAINWSGNWIEKIQSWWAETWKVFEPLWLGSIIAGVILGTIVYFVTYRSIVAYRKHWYKTHPAREKF